jgi:hypothetical protein
MTPLGYPNQPPSQKFRKSLDQIVCFEKYEWKGDWLSPRFVGKFLKKNKSIFNYQWPKARLEMALLFLFL